MSRANPEGRIVLIAGREILDMIEGLLYERVGPVALVVDLKAIMESQLEEFFYGGQIQDTVYDQLSAYRVPTDVIHYFQTTILQYLSERMSLALHGIRPAYHYSFELTGAGDIMVYEQPPTPVFGGARVQREECNDNRHSHSRDLATL
ncbi:hypothetical protein LUCX_50 [Xanthomonas phage vB_XciM_LucasX]|nr:hypothetical protein LUCX_50 [Xanthomonas phage vB_XciM_LucasX]